MLTLSLGILKEWKVFQNKYASYSFILQTNMILLQVWNLNILKMLFCESKTRFSDSMLNVFIKVKIYKTNVQLYKSILENNAIEK